MYNTTENSDAAWDVEMLGVILKFAEIIRRANGRHLGQACLDDLKALAEHAKVVKQRHGLS